MKLLRHGEPGQEKPALLDADGVVRDLSGVVRDIDGTALTPEGLAKLAAVDPSSLPAVADVGRLGPCVGDVRKFVCVGLNYADHAAETNSPIPERPILFMKATTAVAGPNDPIMLPKDSEKTDWEVELGIVIGTTARYVDEVDALDHVAGYCVVNDVSEREFQLERGGQWFKGKSADGFGPIGPYLVTKDEVPEPQRLAMFLEVNGHRYQDGSTETMIFGVAHVVAEISRYMTLQPGDVIATGTPPGVGMGQKPPVFLKAGDDVRLGIEGLGEQRQKIVAYAG